MGLRALPAASELAEQVLPNAALGPSNKAIVDRRVRTVFRRAIAPAAAGLQNMDDAADHPPIILARRPTHIGWKMRRYTPPLPLAQPEQVLAHDDLQESSIASFCQSVNEF